MADFYEALGLARQAEDDEVAKAYRRNALAYNPQCHPDHNDPQDLARKFKEVSQAYTVLSDPKIRAVYDLYGEEGVRHGGTGQQGLPGGLDLDNIDPNAVFKRFFGVDNPFQVLGAINGVQNNQHDFFSHIAVQQTKFTKCPPMEVKLSISLEDVFFGAMRKATWRATHSVAYGADTYTTESFEVRVAKSAKAGDKFMIDGRGNTTPGFARGDVIVILELKAHERFRREGDDLVTTVPVSLSEALCGTTITVQSMEGRELSVLIDEIVHPKYRSRVAGEGLPRSDGPSAPRGDLIIECATKFPSFLTLEQKSELRRILDAK